MEFGALKNARLKGTTMATALQIAANRRNAQRSTGPRTAEGKQASRLNAVKHGMTAKVIVMPHESALDYHEIRGALIESYQPANAHEFMLVDQIAAGYWRTIRARRFETAMFDNQVRTYKRKHGKNQKPDPAHDDEACAVMLQCEDPESFTNYFRYDATISRDYYRAIQTLERVQNARRRQEAQNAKVKSIGSVSQKPNSEPPRDVKRAPAALNHPQFRLKMIMWSAPPACNDRFPAGVPARCRRRCPHSRLKYRAPVGARRFSSTPSCDTVSKTLREDSAMRRSLLVLVFASCALAQVATLTGRVTDPSGAIVPQAVVTAHSLDTGVAATTETTSEGYYTLPSLAPGRYDLSSTKPGCVTADSGIPNCSLSLSNR
jgi:Carboxypeptidase regulatory-like domain